MRLSVVIITKNEAHIIGNTLQSLQAVSDNIVIVDNGSTDDTIAICKKYHAHVIETAWDGYGITKNKGIDAAANDWILSLDADEAIDEELKTVLTQLNLSDENTVYNLKYKNFFCNKWIRFGEWSGDKHIRLFNRKKVRWNDAPVHENLILPADVKIILLKGNVLHYTVNNVDEYMEKTISYAKLNAQKYFLQGKRPDYFKLYLGPMFYFLKHYFFELGFLDGFEGYLVAKTTAWYSFMKYTYLRELIRSKVKAHFFSDNNPGISVVIPNYNGKHLLAQILPDLYIALNNSGQRSEVIIVDDCSTDDSVNFLQQEYPSIQVLKNEINKGFSPSVNRGVLVSQYDYVLILNSDVKLSENYFKTLFRYFDKEDTFGVMGRIIGWDDDEIRDGGKYPAFHVTKIKTTGNYIPVQPGKEDWMYTMYLSGANAFVSRKKFLELNGFNEIFAPFYVEDYELSLRAWRLGYKCYYDHFAICRHRVSVSIKSKNSKEIVNTFYYRNKMLLHAMHLPKAIFYVWYLQNLVEILFQSLMGKTYYLKAFGLFVRKRREWEKSKLEFETLSKQKAVQITLRDVTGKVISSLKGKAVQKF